MRGESSSTAGQLVPSRPLTRRARGTGGHPLFHKESKRVTATYPQDRSSGQTNPYFVIGRMLPSYCSFLSVIPPIMAVVA